MKRIFAWILSLAIVFGMVGCSGEEAPATAEPSGATTVATEPATEVATEPEATVSAAGREALDGKKILFVGNSYTHVGRVVFNVGISKQSQESRSNDRGYFYQLCKAMGMEVSVTSWTFGGHDLTDSLGHACTKEDCKGADHLVWLTDRYFDYVVLQPYYEKTYGGDINAHFQPLLEMFREANPNVKFIILIPHMAYDRGYAWIPDLEKLDQPDVTVGNWGKMLYDIVEGNTQVPGATQPYGRPTFVVSVDEKDGHHQNLLVGYLTAAMVYSAITGDSAVGLPYDFCDDATIHEDFNMEAFRDKQYVYEPYTNFVEVYRSPADMKGLQTLIDGYINAA